MSSAYRQQEIRYSFFVFLNTKGHRIVTSNLLRAFHLVLKKSGIAKLRFHGLRHTFASRLVQNGADLFSVQKPGRWKNTSMVMRYAHHDPESLRKTIEMMDKEEPKIITNLSQSQKKSDQVPLLKLVSN
ncbi:MAG: tyrosine-type recombinase/integrase [Deltaproteobacteria bacterium]|nr:tyrosine-type recombinase/integrase [Deltaproteobacteria bacterium]